MFFGVCTALSAIQGSTVAQDHGGLINVWRYLRNKVPTGFPDCNVGIILYSYRCSGEI